jgi:hypothetical protein
VLASSIGVIIVAIVCSLRDLGLAESVGLVVRVLRRKSLVSVVRLANSLNAPLCPFLWVFDAPVVDNIHYKYLRNEGPYS